MAIKIYGHSDDMVEIRGHIRKEVEDRGKGVLVQVGNRGSGGVVVRMDYAPGNVGVWTARLSQLDEDVPIPWSIIVSDGRSLRGSQHAKGGSTAVVDIDCPEATPVTWVVIR